MLPSLAISTQVPLYMQSVIPVEQQQNMTQQPATRGPFSRQPTVVMVHSAPTVHLQTVSTITNKQASQCNSYHCSSYPDALARTSKETPQDYFEALLFFIPAMMLWIKLASQQHINNL